MQRRILLAAPFAAAIAAHAQEPATIKVDVSLINVPFTVTEPDGRFVSGLQRGDFEVFEDGVRQTIAFFSRATDIPLALAIVADVSPSQEDFLKEHRRDLRDFLKTILRPNDQALLTCFAANTFEVAAPTANADQLEDALKDFQKGKDRDRYRRLGSPEIRENASSVNDAVIASAQRLQSLDGRRALVLFSDGEDTSSAHHLLDAIEAAQELGVTVFALRYTRTRRGQWTARNKQGRGVMQRLADETGGLEFDADEQKNLRAAFQQIADTLRGSYLLAYASTQGAPDGTFRKISIRVKRPGLKVRHKTGYFARA